MAEVKSDDLPEGEEADELAMPTACACLRARMQYVVPESHWSAHRTPRQFWCLHSMSSVGPDDKQVHPEDCQPGRTCFEEEV